MRKVRSLTLPQLLEDYGLQRVSILKVDIEGAEREVFRDTSKWIGRIDSLVVELHDRTNVGCSRSFYNGTPGFDHEWHSGENVILSRKSTPLYAKNASHH
jgi:hypothetical protein